MREHEESTKDSEVTGARRAKSGAHGLTFYKVAKSTGQLCLAATFLELAYHGITVVALFLCLGGLVVYLWASLGERWFGAPSGE